MRWATLFGLLGVTLLAALWWRSGDHLAAQGTVPIKMKFIGTLGDADPSLELGKLWHPKFCTPAQFCAVGDFSGDGRADIAAFSRGNAGDVYVALSRGSAFGPTALWHDSFSFGQELPAVGDFNGDGKEDLVTFTRGTTGDVFVALSDGTRFAGTAQKWHDDFVFGDQVPLVGDFNGDGKADLAAFTRGETGDVYVALSDGRRFVTSRGLWHGDFAFGSEIPAVGDFNGDGKDDIVTFTRGNTGDVYVALSDGTRFIGTGNRWHDRFCFGDEIPATGDFDGDGKHDIVTFKAGGKAVFVATSTGRAFDGTGDQWHSNFCGGPAVCGVGDFNGDRRDDVVSFEHRAFVADISPVLVALSLPRPRSQIQPAALGKLRCSDYSSVTRPERQWKPVSPPVSPPTVEGQVVRGVLNNNDDPRNHQTSHDWCALLEVDSPYLYLLGAGNFGSERRLLETEWESALLPDFAKPDAGDRIWMMGRWIFDCAHDNKTEFHPPQAVAVLREEPAALPGAGAAPVPATQAHVYIGRAGGYTTSEINGINYTFEMELPPRPAPGAAVVWTAFPPADPSLRSVDYVPPEITPLPNAANASRLRVVIPLASRPTARGAVAAQIAAGWNHPPSAAAVRRLRVVFEQVRVRNDQDTFFAGEWYLVVGANGHWFSVPGVVGNPAGYNSVNDNGVIRINHAFDVNVLEDQALRVRVTGFECDAWCGEAPPSTSATDDRIGQYERSFTSAQGFGIGPYTERSSSGDYEVTYRIEAR